MALLPLIWKSWIFPAVDSFLHNISQLRSSPHLPPSLSLPSLLSCSLFSLSPFLLPYLPSSFSSPLAYLWTPWFLPELVQPRDDSDLSAIIMPASQPAYLRRWQWRRHFPAHRRKQVGDAPPYAIIMLLRNRHCRQNLHYRLPMSFCTCNDFSKLASFFIGSHIT